MSERPWYTCLCGKRFSSYSTHPWECPQIEEAVRAYEATLCQVQCAHGSSCVLTLPDHEGRDHLHDDGCCESEADVVRWLERATEDALVLDVEQWPDSAGKDKP